MSFINKQKGNERDKKAKGLLYLAEQHRFARAAPRGVTPDLPFFLGDRHGLKYDAHCLHLSSHQEFPPSCLRHAQRNSRFLNHQKHQSRLPIPPLF